MRQAETEDIVLGISSVYRLDIAQIGLSVIFAMQGGDVDSGN